MSDLTKREAIAEAYADAVSTGPYSPEEVRECRRRAFLAGAESQAAEIERLKAGYKAVNRHADKWQRWGTYIHKCYLRRWKPEIDKLSAELEACRAERDEAKALASMFERKRNRLSERLDQSARDVKYALELRDGVSADLQSSRDQVERYRKALLWAWMNSKFPKDSPVGQALASPDGRPSEMQEVRIECTQGCWCMKCGKPEESGQ